MKLEEAIEINTHISEIKALNNRPDEEQAVKLGIEAMKRIEKDRVLWEVSIDDLLPGETKE